MKILKDGKMGNPEHWKTKVICHKKDKYDKDGCEAEMEVTATDLVLMYWHGTHWPHYYVAVKCPQCGKYTPPGKGNVPEPIFEKINTLENQNMAIFDGFSDD